MLVPRDALLRRVRLRSQQGHLALNELLLLHPRTLSLAASATAANAHSASSAKATKRRDILFVFVCVAVTSKKRRQ
jgi:hypothetical protein